MKQIIKAGTTSKRLVIKIVDTTSSSGAGLTGLTNASSGLSWYYWREDTGDAGGTSVSIVSATRGTFTSGGFKEIDSTNMPGYYELGVPNAVLAAGATWAVMVLRGATNMLTVDIEIELVTVDLQDAAAFGLSRLDAAVTSRLAPTTAGRTLDVSAGGEAGLDWANIGSPTTSVTLSGTTVNDLTTKTGFALSAAGVQAIWDALTSALTTVGSVGKLLVDNVDAAISSRSSHAAADVWAVATRVLTAGTNIVLAKGTGVTGFNDLDATGVENAVWDATLASHLTSGTTGNALNAAGAAGDPWSTALPGAYGAGTAGKIVGDSLDAAVSSRLAPTTAGRTLDVAATGEAGLDFDNIKDASGAHTLTNITVPVVTTAANLTTNNDKTGYALTSSYDPAKTAAQAGDAMALTSGERTTLAGVIWAALTSGLTTVGSVGKLIVDNLNATVSSRLASASYTAPDNSSITAIKAKTDNLPATPAATGDAMTLADGAITAAKIATDAIDADALAASAVTEIQSGLATTGDVPTADQNADALLDRAAGIETGWTPRQGLRIMLAALAGKADGAASTTMHYRDMADTKNRITATVDADGNRTAITTDVS